MARPRPVPCGARRPCMTRWNGVKSSPRPPPRARRPVVADLDDRVRTAADVAAVEVKSRRCCRRRYGGRRCGRRSRSRRGAFARAFERKQRVAGSNCTVHRRLPGFVVGIGTSLRRPLLARSKRCGARDRRRCPRAPSSAAGRSSVFSRSVSSSMRSRCSAAPGALRCRASPSATFSRASGERSACETSASRCRCAVTRSSMRSAMRLKSWPRSASSSLPLEHVCASMRVSSCSLAILRVAARSRSIGRGDVPRQHETKDPGDADDRREPDGRRAVSGVRGWKSADRKSNSDRLKHRGRGKIDDDVRRDCRSHR